MGNSELRPAIFKLKSGNKEVLFHRWGDTISNERLPVTIAIVEDVKTGEIYCVDPDLIEFKDRP